MKKRISCILLICLILSVCACNAREEESVQEEKTEITAVFLAQGALNLEVGERFQQNCTVIPEEADMSGLSWKSANSEIATVTADGLIEGIAPGTTTIICASSGTAMDTCEVTVKAPSAIEQLNEKEKTLFNYMVEEMLSSFYNASAVRIRKIYDTNNNKDGDTIWSVILDIQGTNPAGGTIYKIYGLIYFTKNNSFLCLEAPNADLSHPMSDSVMSASKINSALEEYWNKKHM